jgi:hypothetical protein
MDREAASSVVMKERHVQEKRITEIPEHLSVSDRQPFKKDLS